MEQLNSMDINNRELTFRDFLVKTFSTMALGLAITSVICGIFTYAIDAAVIDYNAIMTPALIAIFAELGVALFFGFRLRKMSSTTAWICFILYSALTGFTLSIIVSAYTPGSVLEAFVVCTILFACMAIVGKNTKADLTKFGTYLMIGLVVIIIVSIINMFIGSSKVDLILTYFGIVLFLGLTVYDVKKLRNFYDESIDDAEGNKKLMIYGAFQLYLDFINLFIRILEILGKRKD